MLPKRTGSLRGKSLISIIILADSRLAGEEMCYDSCTNLASILKRKGLKCVKVAQRCLIERKAMKICAYTVQGKICTQ